MLLVRLPVAMLLGAGVSLMLFYFMHSMISSQHERPPLMASLDTISFIRLEKSIEPPPKKRQLPKKPAQPKLPPQPPAIEVSVSTPLVLASPAIQLSPVVVPSSIRLMGAPTIEGISLPAQQQDVIPLVRIEPRYPRRAMRRKIEGYVVMEFAIRPDGSVENTKVIEAQPAGVFEEAAERAILRWKFKPKLVDGNPVTQIGRQRLEFNFK